MTNVPKYLQPDAMNVEQIGRHLAGEKVENPEWRRQRNDALRAWGLEPDEAPTAEKTPHEMTVAEHVERITRNR